MTPWIGVGGAPLIGTAPLMCDDCPCEGIVIASCADLLLCFQLSGADIEITLDGIDNYTCTECDDFNGTWLIPFANITFFSCSFRGSIANVACEQGVGFVVDLGLLGTTGLISVNNTPQTTDNDLTWATNPLAGALTPEGLEAIQDLCDGQTVVLPLVEDILGYCTGGTCTIRKVV